MAASPYPRTCAFLESIGIDPKTVAIDGFTASGYSVFMLDENGRRRIDPNNLDYPMMHHVDWSDAATAQRAMEIFTVEHDAWRNATRSRS